MTQYSKANYVEFAQLYNDTFKSLYSALNEADSHIQILKFKSMLELTGALMKDTANLFMRNNPKFSYEKFYNACQEGVKDHLSGISFIMSQINLKPGN